MSPQCRRMMNAPVRWNWFPRPYARLWRAMWPMPRNRSREPCCAMASTPHRMMMSGTASQPPAMRTRSPWPAEQRSMRSSSSAPAPAMERPSYAAMWPLPASPKCSMPPGSPSVSSTWCGSSTGPHRFPPPPPSPSASKGPSLPCARRMPAPFRPIARRSASRMARRSSMQLLMCRPPCLRASRWSMCSPRARASSSWPLRLLRRSRWMRSATTPSIRWSTTPRRSTWALSSRASPPDSM